MLDLTRPAHLRKLGLQTRALLGADWEGDNRDGRESLPQAVGRAAQSSACEALLVRSAAGEGVNLVLFPDSLLSQSRILPRGLGPAPMA